MYQHAAFLLSPICRTFQIRSNRPYVKVPEQGRTLAEVAIGVVWVVESRISPRMRVQSAGGAGYLRGGWGGILELGHRPSLQPTGLCMLLVARADQVLRIPPEDPEFT